MRTGMANRAGLDPPSLTPPDANDPEISATPAVADQIGPDGTRTNQMPQAPGMWQEFRMLQANRAAPNANFTPGAANASADPQKGGSPGGGPDTSYTTQNEITSQGPDGVTTTNGVPSSPRKLAYGWSDYSGHWPTFVGAHLKIQWNANPNKPQLNPTPFNNEGPSMNTQYSTPAPFAAGTFIG
jgi:hypothetical protein